jgi:hypothetical protein
MHCWEAHVFLNWGTFCRCLLSPFGLWRHLTLKSLCWFFLCVWYVWSSGILKSPTIIVSGPICPFRSNSDLLNWEEQHLVSMFTMVILLLPVLVQGLHLLGRCSTIWGMPPCFSYFSDRVLHFFPGWLWTTILLLTHPTYLESYVHTQLVDWDGILLTLCLVWPWTAIFPMSE